jgi:hypothetical protein
MKTFRSFTMVREPLCATAFPRSLHAWKIWSPW